MDVAGQPKVLDFGVARITNQDLHATTHHTQAGELLGTLSYMSPEQVQADPTAVDTRADVYALGVLTYELVSGQRPHQLEACALHEAARVILEEEPTTLGGLDPRWRGDIDVLVAKAMAKQKEQRYGSVEELASDIRRHLAHEPILARRIGHWARFRRFARRNKALVAGLAAVFVSLSVGIATSTSLFLRHRVEALRNRDLSARYEVEASANEVLSTQYRREAETANRTVRFLEEIFESTGPLADGELSARDLVDRSAERIRTELDVDPVVRGRLLSLLGKAYNRMGMTHKGESLLREALELRLRTHGADSLEFADVLERVAEAERARGLFPPAEERQRRVVDIRTRHLGELHVDVASAWSNLGNVLSNDGRPAEGLVCYEKALEIGRAIDDVPVEHRSNHATSLFDNGRHAEAEEAFRTLILEARDDPATLATLLSSLGACLKSQQRLEEAEAYLRDAVRLSESNFGAESSVSRGARLTLASTLTDMGRVREAEELLRASSCPCKRGSSAPTRSSP